VFDPMLVVGASGPAYRANNAAAFFNCWDFVCWAVFYPPVSKRILKPYQRDRITSFLPPEEDAKGSVSAFAIEIAVGSAVSGAKGFVMASESTGATSPSGIPIHMSRGLRTGFKGVLLALGCIWRSVAFSADAQRPKDRAGMFLS